MRGGAPSSARRAGSSWRRRSTSASPCASAGREDPIHAARHELRGPAGRGCHDRQPGSHALETTCPNGSGITEQCTRTSSARAPPRCRRGSRGNRSGRRCRGDPRGAAASRSMSSPKRASPMTRPRTGLCRNAWAKASRNTCWPFGERRRRRRPSARGDVSSCLPVGTRWNGGSEKRRRGCCAAWQRAQRRHGIGDHRARKSREARRTSLTAAGGR